MSLFMTVEECSAEIKLAPSTIYKKAMSGELPARKHGTRLVFYRPDILAWSESRAKQPKGPSLSKFQSAKLRLLGSLKTEDNASPSPSSEKRTG